MVAWSTPGAAVLATAGVAGGFSMGQAVGALMVSAVLITLFGITGWFEKLMNRIPVAIASALLVGVLARFGMQGFTAAQSALPLVLMMLAIYLLGGRSLCDGNRANGLVVCYLEPCHAMPCLYL